MGPLVKTATVLLLTILLFSVNALASDQATTLQSPAHGAANDQHTESFYAKAASNEPLNTSDTHEKHSQDHGTGHPNLGEVLPLWSCIPFACMLLSIALFPLAAPNFWHHHFGKVSAFWAASLGIPFLIAFRADALYEIFISSWPIMFLSLSCGNG